MSTVFKLDGSGDLLLDNKRILVKENKVGAATALIIRNYLLLIRGTWFLDSEAGFPWTQVLGVKNPDMSIIRQLLKTELEKIENVTAVNKLVVSLDSKTRVLDINFVVTASDGSIITGLEDLKVDGWRILPAPVVPPILPQNLNLKAYFKPGVPGYSTATWEWAGNASLGSSGGLNTTKYAGWLVAPTHYTTAGGKQAPQINDNNLVDFQGWGLGAGVVDDTGTFVTSFEVMTTQVTAGMLCWLGYPNGLYLNVINISPVPTTNLRLEAVFGGVNISVANPLAPGFHTLAATWDAVSIVNGFRVRIDGGPWLVANAPPGAYGNTWLGFNPGSGTAPQHKVKGYFISDVVESDAVIAELESRLVGY